MSGRRYTRTVHEHAPDPVPMTTPRPEGRRPIREAEAPATLGRGVAALLTPALAVVALLLAVAGLVLGSLWLWRNYHDLALALSFLGAFVLGLSLLWRSVEVLAVHYGSTRPDQVSAETRERLRREVDR